MSNEDFVIGDVVALKSGSANMTVEDIEADYVLCVWMKDDELCSGRFKKAMIEKYSKPDYSRIGSSRRFR